MKDEISEYQAAFDEFQENLFELHVSLRAKNFDLLNEVKILFLGAYENYKNGKFMLAQRSVLIALRLNPTDIDLQLFYLQLLLKTEDKTYTIEIEANQGKFDETYKIIANNIKSGAIVLDERQKNKWIELLTEYGKLNSYVSELQSNGYWDKPISRNKQKIKDLDIEIKNNSLDSNAYFNRGEANFELRNYKEAIIDYNSAVKIDPNYTVAFYNRGLAKYQLKDYQGAIEDLNTAIAIDPEDFDAYYDREEAYYNRGRAKSKVNDYPGALADYNVAIEINPKDAGFYCLRGEAKYALLDPNGAIKDFTTAIEIDPYYADAYINMGNLKIQIGQNESGFQDLQKAAEIQNRT